MTMNGDSVQYRPERPPEHSSYEEYGSHVHNPNGNISGKDEYWEDSSQTQPQNNPRTRGRQAWPFSSHPHASINMMAAASSYNERTGMRSYRYNPVGNNATNSADMAIYHQHQQYPSDVFPPDYPYNNRNVPVVPLCTPGGAGGGLESQSVPQSSSPSSVDRQRNRHNLHHRTNSNPLVNGHRRSNSGEQQDSQPNTPEWANSNNPYINRYHSSQQQQQQQAIAYHAHQSTRDEATATSNSSTNNSNNSTPYINHPRNSHHHLHQLHHPNNPQAISRQFYDSMDVDPSSQNINPNAIPPPGYEDMAPKHAQQLALYNYDTQYASVAALSQQQQQQQQIQPQSSAFVTPPNYGPTPSGMMYDVDPNKQLPHRRAFDHKMKVFISSSSSDQEEVISPTMSNTTATTAASTCTFSSGKDSQSHLHPHCHPSEHFKVNGSSGNRMVVVGGGVVPLSDRKQMQSHAWYERFRELTEYREQHGNCMVPQKYEPNPSLGIWVNKQRMEYKLLQDGEKSSMTPERLSALQSIGFVWAKRKGQATWDAKYKQLQEYKGCHGDCLIPTKYAKDPALGRWVSTQREQYRLWKAEDDRSKMTVEKVRMLEEVGFVWRLQF